jgi:hypothetical protein
MIFSGLKKTLFDHHFFFNVEEIEITTLIPIWGYCSQDLALVCNMHFKPELARATDPWPFLRDSVSKTICKTYHPRCLSWTPLSM